MPGSDLLYWQGVLPVLPEIVRLDGARFTLAVLSSMITPALLISATGTFILSCSQRLGRVVDRIRHISDVLEEMARNPGSVTMYKERRQSLHVQMDILSDRARVLQAALSALYGAAGIFIFTSISIAITSLLNPSFTWVPVLLGIVGACFLFYGSLLMVRETRLAMRNLDVEVRFLHKSVHLDEDHDGQWST